MKRLMLPMILLSVILSGDAMAAAKPDQVFGDWKVNCEQTKSGRQLCHIFQNLTLKDSGQLVLHAAMGYTPKRQPFALFVAPLGIALQPGVQFKVGDGKPHRFPVQVCNQRGCRAGLRLDNQLIQAMRRAKYATFSFARMDGKTFNLQVSLKGFSKGFDAIRP